MVTNSCCRCGNSGHVIDPNEQEFKITWVCQGCNRHVCHNCTLWFYNDLKMREFYETTLCSHFCRILRRVPLGERKDLTAWTAQEVILLVTVMIRAEDVRMVETYEAQATLWRDGESVHVRVGTSYECCPDFSCCYPECKQLPEIRQAFCQSDTATREKYLGTFLANFISKMKPAGNVHIIGSQSQIKKE